MKIFELRQFGDPVRYFEAESIEQVIEQKKRELKATVVKDLGHGNYMFGVDPMDVEHVNIHPLNVEQIGEETPVTALMYKMARLLLNPDELPMPTWGALAMDYLIAARELDEAKYSEKVAKKSS